jgi:glutamate synthase domain-containing protein 3
VVVKGDVGARTGIDQKGGTIVVGGNAGLLTGFMMQRGRQIILGNAGPGLGDSMYDGAIYVATDEANGAILRVAFPDRTVDLTPHRDAIEGFHVDENEYHGK